MGWAIVNMIRAWSGHLKFDSGRSRSDQYKIKTQRPNYRFSKFLPKLQESQDSGRKRNLFVLITLIIVFFTSFAPYLM